MLALLAPIGLLGGKHGANPPPPLFPQPASDMTISRKPTSPNATAKSQRKTSLSQAAAKTASKKPSPPSDPLTGSDAGNSKPLDQGDATDPAGPAAVYASDVGMVETADNSPSVQSCLSPVQTNLPLDQRPAEVLRLAEEAFTRTGSWVVFYRWLFGVDGVIDQLYPTSDERRYFETTPEFTQLLETLTSIRSVDQSKVRSHEPERMVTVRLPRSLHETVIRESEQLQLSMNNYCITKLLQPINKRFTPLETGTRRGRRPGPQLISGKMKVNVKAGRRKSKSTRRKK